MMKENIEEEIIKELFLLQLFRSKQIELMLYKN